MMCCVLHLQAEELKARIEAIEKEISDLMNLYAANNPSGSRYQPTIDVIIGTIYIE
jgi:hypothetical protein